MFDTEWMKEHPYPIILPTIFRKVAEQLGINERTITAAHIARIETTSGESFTVDLEMFDLITVIFPDQGVIAHSADRGAGQYTMTPERSADGQMVSMPVTYDHIRLFIPGRNAVLISMN